MTFLSLLLACWEVLHLLHGGSPRVTLLCLLPPGPRQVYTHTSSSSELLVHDWTLGKILVYKRLKSVGRHTRLVNDGSPLRPVLYMLAPLRKVGQVLVDEVYPALRGSSRFPLPSMWSASQNLLLWPAFWHSLEVTKPLQPLMAQLFFYR